jgi:hypothetical protein
MKKLIFLCFPTLFCINGIAQHVYDGFPKDSSSFTFEPADSLTHTGSIGTDMIDTSGTHLWMIGKTHKTYFTAGGIDTTFAIMTDTVNHYPVNANDWFVLKTHLHLNLIIDFSHKYQTLPHKSGGIVEFSIDTGKTWQNVLGDCNVDSSLAPGILTSNFYKKSDTLPDGQQAFMGVAPSMQYSRLQFFTAIPARLTGGSGCDFGGSNIGKPLYVRFRFESDTFASPFDGWLIDNIKIESDEYGGFVPTVGYNTLNIHPNPSSDGVFIFPELNDEKAAEIEILNVLGESLFKGPYNHRLDLSGYKTGLYLYRVKSGTEYYSGRLIIR